MHTGKREKKNSAVYNNRTNLLGDFAVEFIVLSPLIRFLSHLHKLYNSLPSFFLLKDFIIATEVVTSYPGRQSRGQERKSILRDMRRCMLVCVEMKRQRCGWPRFCCYPLLIREGKSPLWVIFCMGTYGGLSACWWHYVPICYNADGLRELKLPVRL